MKGWKHIVGQWWPWAVSLLFALGVFLFWAGPYYSMMSYQEQLQMFLCDWEYFRERVSVPGGLADWLGEFLVQFYFAPVVGAAIVAVLLLVLQRVAYCVTRSRNTCHLVGDGGLSDRWTGLALSFVPSVLLWAYMGDENVMLGFVVACVFAELAIWHYTHMRFQWSRRWFYPLAMTLILYWTMGAVVWGFVVFVVLWQFVCKHEGRWLTSLVTLVFALFVVVGSSAFLPFPLFRLVGGLCYYRFPALIPLLQAVIILSLGLIPVVGAFVATWWQRTGHHLGWYCVAGIFAVLLVAGWFGVRSLYKDKRFEVIDYDFLVRTEKWQQIVSKAERENPTTPTSVACLNLALQQTGQMGDRMFDFYQNGVQGLLPSFQRDFTTPVPTAEIFLRMGMVNEAMRYFYEAQEAIPSNRKSARLTKRLAECNLINGEYAVARKYLRRLQKTLFYRQWAGRTLELMKSERSINVHPFYGPLRQRLYRGDFLSSDREMDQMIGLLLASRRDNRMAYEYLMAYEQLNGDINRFEQYYALGQYVNFDHIPSSYLETRLVYWSQHRDKMHNPPIGVSQMMGQRFMDFSRQFSQKGSLDAFRGTYWYYFANQMRSK